MWIQSVKQGNSDKYALKERDYTVFYWNNKRKPLVFKKKQEDSVKIVKV